MFTESGSRRCARSGDDKEKKRKTSLNRQTSQDQIFEMCVRSSHADSGAMERAHGSGRRGGSRRTKKGRSSAKSMLDVRNPVCASSETVNGESLCEENQAVKVLARNPPFQMSKLLSRSNQYRRSANEHCTT
jgi:hypothetical protein